MHNRILTAITAGWLLVAATPAQAEHEPSLPYYFGFDIAFLGSDQDCDYYGYNCDGSDTGFKLHAGKQLHENLAVEISFLDLGRLRNEGFDVDRIAESEGVNFSLLGIIPISEYSFFYGKAGYMLSDTRYTRVEGGNTTTTDDESSDFTYGLGFAMRFNRRYDFRVEFERLNDLGDDYKPGGDSITSFSIGGSIYID